MHIFLGLQRGIISDRDFLHGICTCESLCMAEVKEAKARWELGFFWIMFCISCFRMLISGLIFIFFLNTAFFMLFGGTIVSVVWTKYPNNPVSYCYCGIFSHKKKKSSLLTSFIRIFFLQKKYKMEIFFLRMLWENHICYVNSKAKTCSALDSLRRVVFVLLGFANNRNYLLLFAFHMHVGEWLTQNSVCKCYAILVSYHRFWFKILYKNSRINIQLSHIDCFESK